jgi:hypothetical protein
LEIIIDLPIGFPINNIISLLEMMLLFNHLYQAYSGPELCEFPVGTFQLPGSRKKCISFGLLEVEMGKTES